MEGSGRTLDTSESFTYTAHVALSDLIKFEARDINFVLNQLSFETFVGAHGFEFSFDFLLLQIETSFKRFLREKITHLYVFHL